MKRTSLVLDEHLLEEAVKLSGERTYSAVWIEVFRRPSRLTDFDAIAEVSSLHVRNVSV